MYIVAILNDKQIMGLVAGMGDDSVWVRWQRPLVVDSKDYPRVLSFKTRGEAETQGKSVVRAIKRLSVLDEPHYKVLPLFERKRVT